MASQSKLPINVGFIGLSTTGWGAVSHYPALSHPSLQSTFQITATHTSSEASAKAAAENYNSKPGISSPISTYYGPDASQVARNPKVDVVAISVKVPNHKKYLDAAIDAGKHYFVEYPPLTNLEDTLELYKKTEEKGLTASVGLQGRQSASIRKLKKIIDSGKLGKIISTTAISFIPRNSKFFPPEVASSNAYVLDPANGVTLLSIPVGHQLDTLMYLLGSFTSLNARAVIQYPRVTIIPSDPSAEPQTVPSVSPDHYTITGQLESGTHANIIWRTGYNNSPGRFHFIWIIDGENGSIKLRSDALVPFPGSFINVVDPQIEVDSKPLDDYLRDEGIKIDPEEDKDLVVEDGEKGNWVEFIRRSWVEFGKTLKGGKGEFATLLDAVRVFRVLDAIEKSAAKDGAEVKIEY